MKSLLPIIIVLSLLGAGCQLPKPRPLTLQEQEAYMARQQCEQEASWQTPDWPWNDNPMWNAYFIQCMNSLGISDATLIHMWY